jgi:DNA-3-methyladenine glycosylase II
MRIPVREPFDFQRTLRFVLSPPALLNGRLFEPLLDLFENGEYRRAAELNGQPVLYAVREVKAAQPTHGRARRSLEVAGLDLQVLAGARDEATERALAEFVQRQFSTGLDLKPFYRLAASDRVLSRLVQRFCGMRIPQASTVYETLIFAILEQQVNLSFAHQVKKALVQAYGSTIEFEGRTYRTFPEPVRLALATPGDLRPLQISGPKARYIIALSRAVLDGRLDLDALRQVEPAQAVERLLREKGVGLWTAHYVGLRALGHLDCLPAADVGLQKSIQRFYGLRQKPTPARVEKIARSWTGWRSYATFYLWLTYWEEAAWRDALAAQVRAERRKSRIAHAPGA